MTVPSKPDREAGRRFGMSAAAALWTLSRPRFWMYLAGPVLVAAAFAASAPAELLAWRPLAFLAFALVPANVFVYGVNDIFDAEIDAANPKKAGREGRFTGQRGVVAAVGLSGALGLLAVLLLPAPARPWLAGFLALSFAYSAPPLRFKARPFLDSLSNGLYILPGVAAYVGLAGHAPPIAALAGGWLWTMAMHTYSAVPDIGPDSEAGIETTATRLGRRGALLYCALCWTGAALAFGRLHPAFGALMAVYPLLAGWSARERVDIHRVYWWFPAINTLVGMSMTLAGLWTLTRP